MPQESITDGKHFVTVINTVLPVNYYTRIVYIQELYIIVVRNVNCCQYFHYIALQRHYCYLPKIIARTCC